MLYIEDLSYIFNTVFEVLFSVNKCRKTMLIKLKLSNLKAGDIFEILKNVHYSVQIEKRARGHRKNQNECHQI